MTTFSRVAAATLSSVVLVALVFELRLGPVERFRRQTQIEDMHARLESMPIPEGFRLIGVSEAPLPVVQYYFAAPTTGQPLCDDVFEAARFLGKPTPWPDNPCGFTMQIVAGWRAWLAATPRYELRAFAFVDERPMLSPSDEICIRELAEKPPLEFRMAPCWLREGEAYVYYMLFGSNTLSEDPPNKPNLAAGSTSAALFRAAERVVR